MSQFASYPVIRTKNFAQTVGFYEDVFGFIPVYEIDGFVRLRHQDTPDVMISIIEMNHTLIPEGLHQSSQSQIMSFATDKFQEIYDALYYEGLEILKEPSEIGPNIRHFMVADPYNDVIINIVTPVQAVQSDVDVPVQGQAERCEQREHACTCC